MDFFFFSSRRRHTRFDCDWSSDVCSSDLHHVAPHGAGRPLACRAPQPGQHLERSEEHTSELQSQSNLVCRLLLEKKTRVTPTWINGLDLYAVIFAHCSATIYSHSAVRSAL